MRPVFRAMEVAFAIMLPLACHALDATPDEMWEKDRWVHATLIGDQAPTPAARITVVANNDTVQPNARLSGPMQMGGRSYRRGLFCHATSELVVRLPGPATRFEALVGVDTNEQTGGGRGSVVFSVTVGDEALFRSEVLHEGTPPVRVDVELGGAEEFTLLIDDSGDGIACDQASWAEAKVTLADGSTVWLGEMPLEQPQRPDHSAQTPFSFTYGGRPSSELLPGWTREYAARTLDDARTEHTLTFSDPDTGLVARLVAVEYTNFPVVEWTVYFGNTGQADTPILESIQALDTALRRFQWPPMEGVEFRLHHFTGSPCKAEDYRPHETELAPSTVKRIGASGGRPTNSDLCFFNVEWPSEGVIIGVGWPGQWASEFARDAGESLGVRIGQELTHLTLHPGEQIRTPLIALLFWKGEWIRGQNLWRRWMLAHNLPRPGGKLPPVPEFAGASSYQFGEMVNANEANQKQFIDRYLEEGLRLDYWWMDAGWYINETGWPNTGTWEVDRERFPGGLRAITDHAHARGVKCILWFEPERVTPGTWLYENHPEWLLGADGAQKLLDLGNPDAQAWLTDRVDRVLTDEGIDLYRTDFNMDPLGFWRANDAEDRQGITEIRYIEGFLAGWDEIQRRHPNTLFDTCASGGRRNDLETLRRAVPLHRSDYILEPIGGQCQTYGIAHWIPFFGAGQLYTDEYRIRSVMGPHFTGCWDVRNDELDYAFLKRMVDQWKSVAHCFLGDYYPLTPYSLGSDIWLAWQFDRPDLGEGLVEVFRREDSIYESARLPLRGLDENASYTVQDLDEEETHTMTGAELMDRGIPVSVMDRPGAAFITYKRVDE